jgi:hypothetical protein
MLLARPSFLVERNELCAAPMDGSKKVTFYPECHCPGMHYSFSTHFVLASELSLKTNMTDHDIYRATFNMVYTFYSTDTSCWEEDMCLQNRAYFW